MTLKYRSPDAARFNAQQARKAKLSAATNLTADQLAIMKFIRKSGKEKVTVREIEKSRFGNTPWFKAWLQKTQPKKDLLVSEQDISFADVELPEAGEPRNLADNILRFADPVTLNWNDEYSIFSNNKIFALAVDERRVQELFSPFGPAAVQFVQGYNEKARMSGHPTVPGKIIVAWVRYSEMEDGTLWVHEVQTDMFWAVGARHMTRQDAQEAMRRGDAYSKEANYYIREVIKQRATADDKQMQLLEFEVMKEFVAEHPDNRIVFPTPKYRVDNYPADLFGDRAAPASVYNEIPRKMRFEKKPAESLNLPEAPAGEVWVYASTGDTVSEKVPFAFVSRSVRALIAGGQPSEVLKASTSEEVAELVNAVAADADMAKTVVAAMDGKTEHFGLAKVKVLAEESGSTEAKKLFAALWRAGTVASAKYNTKMASEIKKKAEQLAKDESSKNEVLSLVKLSYMDNDHDPLSSCSDIQAADEEMQDLVYGGPYADYTVGDLKALAVALGLDLSQWNVDSAHYSLS